MTNITAPFAQEETMIKQTIRQYWTFSVLSQLSIALHSAIYTTFLLSRGLNLLEVNLVNVVFYVTRFVCEIPTGAFADVFGRKTSFVISSFLFSGGLLAYAFTHTVVGFACSEMALALAMTFANGAFEAWMVDRLKHHGYTGSLNHIYAREQQLDQVMGILAGLSGAYLASISFKLPWLVGSGIMLVTAIGAWAVIQEEYFVPKRFSFREGLEHMKGVAHKGIRYAMQQKTVRFLLVITVVQSFAVMAPNMQWQPFFLVHLHSKASLGWIWTGMALCLILGSQLSKVLLRRYQNEKRILVVAQVAVGLGIIATVLAHQFMISLALFLLHEIARGVFGPVKSSYLQDQIPSAERATVGSFDSIARHGGGAFGLIASGALAQYGSIPLAWIVAGILLVVGTLVVAKNGQRT